MEDLMKRRGKFKIVYEILKESPQAIMMVLSQVAVVKAGHTPFSSEIEYFGYSRYFDILGDSEMCGEYVWTIGQDEKGFVDIRECKRLR